jgi:hypothetical protein
MTEGEQSKSEREAKLRAIEGFLAGRSGYGPTNNGPQKNPPNPSILIEIDVGERCRADQQPTSQRPGDQRHRPRRRKRRKTRKLDTSDSRQVEPNPVDDQPVDDRFELAKIALLTLTDGELQRIEAALPLIRRVVRMYEDQHTGAGLSDLTNKPDVQQTLAELDADLEKLSRDSTD